MMSREFRGAFVWDIHLLPLPHHRAAFPLSIAIRCLRSLAEGKGYNTNLYAMQFIDVVLCNEFQEIILDLSHVTEVNKDKEVELPHHIVTPLPCLLPAETQVSHNCI